ncbi:MAG: hypothetical protein HKN09_05235 [Saprospiraceae bacterium]|nr:hypothetical protein [Saprospiraceae bacterium]
MLSIPTTTYFIKRKWLFFFLGSVLILVNASEANAQHFKFAVHGGIGLSQVDGDKISGFNKFVYDIGLEGSYQLSFRNEFAVVQSITRFGSSTSENFPNSAQDYFVELSLTSANILFAFRHNVGLQSKRDEVRSTISFGLKVHQLISSDWDVKYNPRAGNKDIQIDGLKDRFLSTAVEYSIHAGKGVFLYSTMDIVLQSIASDEESNGLVKGLIPYYFVMGVKYQI